MSRSKKIIVAFMLLMMMTMNLAAQEKEVEMADTMRSNGRIWVVVAVMLTILAGINIIFKIESAEVLDSIHQ